MTAQRKCKNKKCPEYFYPKDPKSTPRQEWCSENCKVEIALQHYRRQEETRVRARKKAEKKNKQYHAKQKKALKANSHGHQTKLTQREFNKLIRLIDSDQPCISCPEEKINNAVGGSWDCGHYKTVGGFPELRFCFLNAYKQCKSCNGGSGNFSRKNRTVRKDYTEQLVDRMGQVVVDLLNGPIEAKHYTCDQLIEMRAEFAAEIRYIEKNGEPSRDWRDISTYLDCYPQETPSLVN